MFHWSGVDKAPLSPKGIDDFPTESHKKLISSISLSRTSSREGDAHSEGSYSNECNSTYVSLSSYRKCPKAEKSTDVVIAIQAFTMSSLNTNTLRGQTIENVTLDTTTGNAIVGVVRDVGTSASFYGINVGDRVASVVRSIIENPKYSLVHVRSLVRIPAGVDSAEAACVAYSYMIAFQALHHGKRASLRYSNRSLVAKRILVINGASLVGQAVIELSCAIGAYEVYATSDYSHHEHLRSLGAIPLLESPDEWLPVVQSRIDVVLETVRADNYQAAKRALKRNGKLVCIDTSAVRFEEQASSSWLPLFHKLWAQLSLLLDCRASYYDFFDHMDSYPTKFRTDLCFVLSLLANGNVTPKIAKFISSDEVSYGLATISPGIIKGSLICEPWRTKGSPCTELAGYSTSSYPMTCSINFHHL